MRGVRGPDDGRPERSYLIFLSILFCAYERPEHTYVVYYVYERSYFVFMSALSAHSLFMMVMSALSAHIFCLETLMSCLYGRPECS